MQRLATMDDPAPEPAVHNVLWTSGWDSTFRVLDLILIKREAVQPVYVMDDNRKSTSLELRAMKRIRKMVEARDPEAGRLLRPVRLFKKRALQQDPDVSHAYATIKGDGHLGKQYEWLGWLAKQEGFDRIELGVHKDDRFAQYLDRKGFEAYRQFAFPLLGITKIEMGEYAAQHGFADIMEQTWFCHDPLRGKPCGTCVPCTQTKDEGMGRRVPPRNFFDRVIYLKFARKLWRLRVKLRDLRLSVFGR